MLREERSRSPVASSPERKRGTSRMSISPDRKTNDNNRGRSASLSASPRKKRNENRSSCSVEDESRSRSRRRGRSISSSTIDRNRYNQRNLSPPKPSNVLGAFNLPKTMTRHGLENLFEKYGTVERSVIVEDKFTRASKGFGFITMSDKSEAFEAKAKLDKTLVEEREIRVDYSYTKTGMGRERSEYSSSDRRRSSIPNQGHSGSRIFDSYRPIQDSYRPSRDTAYNDNKRRGGDSYRPGAKEYRRPRPHEERRVPPTDRPRFERASQDREHPYRR